MSRIELTLKFPARGLWRLLGRYKKKKVGFRFTEAAWFTAFEVLDVDPSDFNKKPEDEQTFAVAYGAAVYDCNKRGKRVFFSYESLKQAFENASISQGKELGKAMANATMSRWVEKALKNYGDDGIKKK
jgi:hypothetical protein